MCNSSNGNFAASLVGRLGKNASLTDAATARKFSDLPNAIAGFASGFLSNGLSAGDHLLVSCGVNASSALAYLGAVYAGLVPVLIDERSLPDSGHLVFAKAQAKAAWTDDKISWNWPEKNGYPHFKNVFSPAAAESTQPAPRSKEDIAVLIPTSGSTGSPRLVTLSHGNLIANTEAIVRSQRLESDDKAMLIMPVSYCFGASVVHTHLCCGGSIVFDSRFMFPDKVLHSINRYGCTSFAGVPTVYNILLRRSNLRSITLPTLRRFLQAGGALAPENVKAFTEMFPKVQFFVMYGQTEATARITCLPPERLQDKLGSAGQPLDNLRLRVVDENGRELAAGQCGELEVSGPSISNGYFHDAEASRLKFKDGWLKTGDICFRDDDGFVWIEGRKSEFIKMRGVRVSFAEIESRVSAIAGVSECAALAVQHPEAGEAVSLFIVAENGTQELEEKVQRSLPTQWTCCSIKVVSELPRTANGKLARSQLRGLL